MNTALLLLASIISQLLAFGAAISAGETKDSVDKVAAVILAAFAMVFAFQAGR